ncbi:hypothetical protein LGK97_19020 [Clostridium sp. CS001]|uniref:hypothetical protein n=1 Tax=Clostridium sp. CS001 TaxID=2880648 RepID=UPI001CF16ECA|nr:hypothetical protein [Clostridium sp. CS001]MCB2291807.1 hypothetical protein [Clostridium sp. CS001]
MVSDDVKMRVAQNCHKYRSINDLELINMITYEAESCNSCINYIRERCTEGLFDEIREIIRLS